MGGRKPGGFKRRGEIIGNEEGLCALSAEDLSLEEI